MPRYKVRGTGKTVNLTQNEFKAQGGEGSIYILGDTVYKVCEPGKTIPEAKLKELSILQHPHIICPMDMLLDSKSHVVGYTMRAVPGSPMPLAQILSKTYRDREGVTPKHMMSLVQFVADGIRFIHSHDKYLQVDGNEWNYMVSDKYDDVHFIDTNSYQTPHFPADALMLSIRDWHVAQDTTGKYIWTQLSDWWSFAVVSFYMFTAIHPFMGFHPDFPNVKTSLMEQMKHYKSVLDPMVQFPQAAVYPFEDVIPGGKNGAFMQWYRALFVDGKRLPAPKDFQAMLTFIAKVQEIIGSNNFDIHELFECATAITGFVSSGNNEAIVAHEQIYINQRMTPAPAAKKFRVGFTSQGVPVSLHLDDEDVRLQNLQSGEEIPIQLKGKDIMSCEGRLYVQGMRDIFEVHFVSLGNNILANGKTVAAVMPNATQAYQGVVIQDTFGNKLVSVFPDAGYHRQLAIKELVDYRIVAAKYERNVLMILGVNRKTHEHDRLILRFAKDWSNYDLRKVENIRPSGINFTVTEKGVCVCITEEEKVEIFSCQAGANAIKSVADPAIHANMYLSHRGSQVLFALNKKLFSLSMK